jgi:DNA-binding NarL/FixJ family response regulator
MTYSSDVVWPAPESDGPAIGLRGVAQAVVPPSMPTKLDAAVLQVAVIDSHSLTRDCITASISHFFDQTTVSSFSSVLDCNHRRALRISLIVLYLHSDEREALELIGSLSSAHSHSIVFLISDHDYQSNPEFIRAAWRLGARGFVSTKTTSLALALSALRFVLAGGFFAPVDDFLCQSHAPSRPPPAVPAATDLTARETIVLRLLAEGKTNKVIAQELRLSSNTVKVHVHNILRKMRVSSRTKAAMIVSTGGAETGVAVHAM